jgi:hypothetical protein
VASLLSVLLYACAAPDSVEDLAKHDLQCDSVNVFEIPGYPRASEDLVSRRCPHFTEWKYHVEGCEKSRGYYCKQCDAISSEKVCSGDGPVVE